MRRHERETDRLGARSESVDVERQDDPGLAARRRGHKLLGEATEAVDTEGLVTMDGAEKERRRARLHVVGRDEVQGGNWALCDRAPYFDFVPQVRCRDLPTMVATP